MARKTGPSKVKALRPYTSSSLAVSRRMLAPNQEHFEEQAILHDIKSRYRHIQGVLPHYHRSTPASKELAREAEDLVKEWHDRVEALPNGELKNTHIRQGLW